MEKCNNKSKLTCRLCKHFSYCDVAFVCDGKCKDCNILSCENNPKYKDYYTDLFYQIQYQQKEIEWFIHVLKDKDLGNEIRETLEDDKQQTICKKIRLEIELTNLYN